MPRSLCIRLDLFRLLDETPLIWISCKFVAQRVLQRIHIRSKAHKSTTSCALLVVRLTVQEVHHEV